MNEDDLERLKLRPCVSRVDDISACPTDSSKGKPDAKWRRLRGLDSRYKCSRVIGSGSFGKVWEALDTHTGSRVAVKKMSVTADDYSSDGFPISALREISILRFLSREPNIVRLIASDCTLSEKKFYVFMIFELMHQSLHDAMYKEKRSDDTTGPRLQPDAIQSVMCQILRGVAALHSHGILHSLRSRDLKPQNILIAFDNTTVKIADFGLSRQFHTSPRPYTQEVVSLWYRSPEVLLGEENYSTAVDIFSVGVIMFELLLGEPAFVADTEIQMLLEIFRILGSPTEKTWPGVSRLENFHIFPKWTPQDLSQLCPLNTSSSAIDLLSKLLPVNPLKRISAKESLGHSFFLE